MLLGFYFVWCLCESSQNGFLSKSIYQYVLFINLFLTYKFDRLVYPYVCNVFLILVHECTNIRIMNPHTFILSTRSSVLCVHIAICFIKHLRIMKKKNKTLKYLNGFV